MMGAVLGGSLAVAASTMAYAVRGRSSSLLAPSVYKGSADRPWIALTFDDGPSESTPEILELLAKFGAQATFFQCGMHVRRLPGVARMIAAAGHEIGNHTDTHAALWLRSPAFIGRELSLAQQAIFQETGFTPSFFRAPYGARWFGLRAAQLRLGLMGVMWTALARDWALPSESVTARLLAAAKNGAIFCLHDGRERRSNPDIRETVAAVGSLVPRLLDRGFQLPTLSRFLCPTT
jgi:peptidoglycan/xylan/chitin deacetylase (PgdA/CDA1 family)